MYFVSLPLLSSSLSSSPPLSPSPPLSSLPSSQGYGAPQGYGIRPMGMQQQPASSNPFGSSQVRGGRGWSRPHTHCTVCSCPEVHSGSFLVVCLLCTGLNKLCFSSFVFCRRLSEHSARKKLRKSARFVSAVNVILIVI